MKVWLSDLRGRRSQAEIATLCEISQQAYSYIETGQRNPSALLAKKMGQVLKFDWTLFF
jgi:putative transcriptional regulator